MQVTHRLGEWNGSSSEKVKQYKTYKFSIKIYWFSYRSKSALAMQVTHRLGEWKGSRMERDKQ